MAQVDFFISTNMSNQSVWYGDIYTATSGLIGISDGFRRAQYFGSFTFDKSDNVFGRLDSFYEYQGGTLTRAVTNMNVDAFVAMNFIENNQLSSFFSLVLNGDDTIKGSNFADTIFGYAGNDSIDAFLGNDTIDAGSGRDLIRGSGGNDFIVGGQGNDTAEFSSSFSQYRLTFNWPSQIYTISGPDGTDALRSVERLRHADGDRFIEDAAGLTGVVHRFYNTQKGVHFYTASNDEANSIRNNLQQFEHEGLAFKVTPSFTNNSADIFRFYNTQTGYHFYTASSAERDQVIRTLTQFNYEGVGFQAYSRDSGPQEEVYRFYNTQTKAHFFTTSEAERDQVNATLPQFLYEGVAFYVDIPLL